MRRKQLISQRPRNAGQLHAYKQKIRDTAKRQRDSNNPELLVQPPSKKREACTSLTLPYQSTEYGNTRHLIPLAHTRLNATGTLLLSGFLLRSLPPRIIHSTSRSQHSLACHQRSVYLVHIVHTANGFHQCLFDTLPAVSNRHSNSAGT